MTQGRAGEAVGWHLFKGAGKQEFLIVHFNMDGGGERGVPSRKKSWSSFLLLLPTRAKRNFKARWLDSSALKEIE
ncbi:unnamed protein product [Cuscuta campestris]|uniref:Uncharacterized protein n=1 Tax=Cuscuta campestris TaxID=132261 RepID=A0A484ND35_9ASTE|nr:unnamed protein product [Cuscuta campestris]